MFMRDRFILFLKKYQIWLYTAILVVVTNWSVPYVALMPGTVYPISSMFTKDDHVQTLGDWNFLTVKLLHLTVLSYVYAKLNPNDYEIIPEEWLMKPGETNSQYTDRQHKVMTDTIEISKSCSSKLLKQTLNQDVTFQFKLEGTDVGGPSAGSAFCLAFADSLSKDEMAKGYRIAATGTVTEDGEVGEIGGLKWKIKSAIDAGIQIVFVPFEEEQEAISSVDFWKSKQIAGADSLRVYPIKHVSEAVYQIQTLQVFRR